ncbi:DUF6247 family protein [Embleya sp. NPDC020630]|uniref:DUF6247 family protein n=1 Tax=Embleya sp. NPDC020630 TaxID=3363979 RepID=UPI00379507DA
MDEQIPSPRSSDLVIRVGGARWPSPDEIRAELPDDIRDEFEHDFEQALAVARDLGRLESLAGVLDRWQGHLVNRRSPGFAEAMDIARRVAAGEKVPTFSAQGVPR